MRTLGVVFVAVPLALGCGAGRDLETLTLATTTSVEDSGLLDRLLPPFSRETGIRVKAVAVGSGAALRMAASGDADILLTHAPDAEAELVRSGVVIARVPLMENEFLIAGPAEDPAGVREAESAAEALRRIHDSGAGWVSRGDRSGTHLRERALWLAAGLDPDAQRRGWTITGAGMGLTLQVAGERQAYLLSDLGTFLAFRDRTSLVAHSRPDPALLNTYSLLRVDPERFPGRIRAEQALALEAYLLRSDVQREIGAFGGERFGRSLFRPLQPEQSP